MELLQAKNITFSYPHSEGRALEDVSFTINEGEINLFCGACGSGKTTILSLLKPEIAPYGTMTGTISFKGKNITELTKRESCEAIGYLPQNIETSMVTDTVWHELAFGMESLGYSSTVMRRRIGEMVSFFGLEKWYHMNTWDLSGGAKKMVSLASILTLEPELLLLDEPTANLDPVATKDFLSMLNRINKELGITVVIIEQNLTELLPIVDQAYLFDEGKLFFEGEPRQLARFLYEKKHPLRHNLPAATKLYFVLEQKHEQDVWLSVSEGRATVKELLTSRVGEKSIEVAQEVKALQLKHIYFRYGKKDEDILVDVSFGIPTGKMTAVVGGNGCGKSTLLSLCAGVLKPYRGKVILEGDVSYLPQNASLLFVHDTVEEELKGCRAEIIDALAVSYLLKRHPMDLSGGESQLVALCKILSQDKDIILLDEPTQGIDGIAKLGLNKVLSMLLQENRTILVVSHDLEFVAQTAAQIVMLFDQNVMANETKETFFADNFFYTTQANRLVGKGNPQIITCEDVILACKEKKVRE